MRGHLELMELRRKGLRPSEGVVICVGSHSLPADMSGTGAADLDIVPTDAIDQIDLRCIIGLKAVVFGDDAARVVEVAKKAEAAGAAGVIGLRFHVDGGIFEEWLYAFKPWTTEQNKWPT